VPQCVTAFQLHFTKMCNR